MRMPMLTKTENVEPKRIGSFLRDSYLLTKPNKIWEFKSI